MESHLDIKRAGATFLLSRNQIFSNSLETMRRVFHRWLAAARSRHQRRVLLRDKELRFDRAAVQVAWDKWREKYIREKLRPIVGFYVIRGSSWLTLC